MHWDSFWSRQSQWQWKRKYKCNLPIADALGIVANRPLIPRHKQIQGFLTLELWQALFNCLILLDTISIYTCRQESISVCLPMYIVLKFYSVWRTLWSSMTDGYLCIWKELFSVIKNCAITQIIQYFRGFKRVSVQYIYKCYACMQWTQLIKEFICH